MVTQAPRRSAVAIALAFTLSCVGLMIFVWTQFGGTIPFSPQGYRVKAVFNETGLLVPNADVRIAGVNVGKVTSVQAQGTHSLVTMNIQQQYAPIPRDTRAILREKTLLGEGFIALSSGDGQGPKLPDGGTIPSAQIAPTQQLDQVLNSFTTPVQHDLQAFLIGTGAALHGRGQSLSDAFGNFDPTATQLNAIIQVLNQQQGNLQSLIANGATVLTSLGDRGTALRDLISSGDSVLSATAAQDRSLTATVNAMPAFLAQLRTTLGRVNRTLQIAHPSLTALQGVAPRVKPALQALSAATPALVALLREAPGVLRVADRALPSVNRFIGELKPVGDALLPAAQQLAPVINVLAEYRQNIDDDRTRPRRDDAVRRGHPGRDGQLHPDRPDPRTGLGVGCHKPQPGRALQPLPGAGGGRGHRQRRTEGGELRGRGGRQRPLHAAAGLPVGPRHRDDLLPPDHRRQAVTIGTEP
jgi:virulence factor Mce-like protein